MITHLMNVDEKNLKLKNKLKSLKRIKKSNIMNNQSQMRALKN
jgi:hypothetical protein